MAHASFPLCTALRQTLPRYTLSTFKHDFLAAFVVSLMALPLSMALSVAIGLPPQYGIYTAIAAGLITPLLGGSIPQVSGPTAAFVVILAPIVTTFGHRGIIWCSILAGTMLLIMSALRIGRLIHYVPYPVTTGFTSGIAVVLGFLSLNDFLGLRITNLEGSFLHKAAIILSHFPSFDPTTSLVAGVTLLFLVFGNHITKFIPSAVLAILIGSVLALVLTHLGYNIDTIGSRFSYLSPLGEKLPGIPPYLPSLHLPTTQAGELFTLPSLVELQLFFFPALTIAILAALESLLSATVADNMMGTRHSPDAELNAIGIGNILSGFVTGIPATGAIARTATNIKSGARTPIASAMHALFLAAYVVVLAPYINYVPMACLAALLLYTAYHIAHPHQFFRAILLAPRSDIIVLLLCFSITVFFDMVAGVTIGMICSAFLLMKHVSELTHVELETNRNGKSSRPLPPGCSVYKIRGPIFFGSVERAFNRYLFAHDYTTHFILDITDVPFIDLTGLVALKAMLISIAGEHRKISIICTDAGLQEKIKQKIAGHPISQLVRFSPSIEDGLSYNGCT